MSVDFPNERLRRIAYKLIETIPEPLVPAAKPQKSWATLDLDRELELLVPFVSGKLKLLPGAICKTIKVDSQGVTLETAEKQQFRYEDKNWKLVWKKVPKRRTGKKRTAAATSATRKRKSKTTPDGRVIKQERLF